MPARSVSPRAGRRRSPSRREYKEYKDFDREDRRRQRDSSSEREDDHRKRRREDRETGSRDARGDRRDHERERKGSKERQPSSPQKRQRTDGEDVQKKKTDGPTAVQAAEAVAAGPAATTGEAAAVAPAAAVARKAANTGKTGGVYVPPFKLARMMQEVNDKASPEYQRLTWEALKKSLNGIVNKVNAINIKNILAEVFRENLIRGRGLFCRSIMKSQMASPAFSPVYAALVAVVNTKFPEIGELLLSRLILQFKRSFARNDKPVCTAAAKFLAHLINQGVAHEVLALEMLILMLNKVSDDSVEMASEFVKEVGAHLQDVAPSGLHSVFERFRAVLHEGSIDKRVQFIIEGLFAIRKAGFEASGFKAIKAELDLVEAEDQITHELGLEDSLSPETALDVFKVDPDFEQHEKEYAAISREILGEEEEEPASEAGEGEEGAASDEEEDEEEEGGAAGGAAGQQVITDATQTNLVNLRRTIYLTIMSSMDFEEAGHKLLKIPISPGQEIEYVTMIIECCSQERTYKRFFGLLAQRFCYLHRQYAEMFDQCFRQQYAIIHRLETNKLRNVASLFAHLLATDALPWSVLDCMRLTEEDTTSSSRIFIKYLFQELSSTMGLVKLNERLNDPNCQAWFDGIFPKDTQANLRFAINFFTSIGLGGLTDRMREYYKKMPQLLAEKQAALAAAAPKPSSSSETTSSSDTSSSSDSDSDSSSSSDDSSSSSGSGDSSSSSSESDSDNGSGHKKRPGSKKKTNKAAGNKRGSGIHARHMDQQNGGHGALAREAGRSNSQDHGRDHYYMDGGRPSGRGEDMGREGSREDRKHMRDDRREQAGRRHRDDDDNSRKHRSRDAERGYKDNGHQQREGGHSRGSAEERDYSRDRRSPDRRHRR